ncbi:unnamed protein product [Chrysodeixis includens]|uniref:Uncharacterized protein n=1 Tax=Chrysodeixis includens TaxID=689277 RepID=A0A9P0FSH7_CHRIL|nr:unnamed protein product [Chrysodeixis includens]
MKCPYGWARGSLPSYDNFTTAALSRVTLRRSHRTSPLSATSFRRVISHALDNPAGSIKGESSQSQASVHSQANYDTDRQLTLRAFGNINKALTCNFRVRINQQTIKMRFLHLIVFVLTLVLLAAVGDARPHNHKQKRASFCMLKICSYTPMAHKVQRLR